MQSYLGKRIGLSLFFATVLSFGAIVFSLWYMSHQQDQQAIAAEHSMINWGKEALEAKLDITSTDYARWEEAYNYTVVNDAAWLSENIGTGVYGNNTIDIAVIINRHGVPLYAWDVETGETPDTAFIDAETLDRVKSTLAKLPDTGWQAQSVYTLVRGKPALLSVVKFVPPGREANFTSRALPTLVLGYYLTPERIADVGKGFLIHDLRLVMAAKAPPGTVVLTNPDGKNFGYLAWSPTKPGGKILQQAAMPLALYLVAFLSVMLFIGYRTKRIADRLAASEEEARIAATTDRLSGLANRHGFLSHIESPLIAAAARRGEAGVIFIDLNGFKAVNDTAGHHTGDKLIQLISERLRRAVPRNTFVARIGGDEFAAVLTGKSVVEEVPACAEAIVRCFDEPVTIDRGEHHVSCAAGYVLSTGERIRSFEQMLQDADTAMYFAKTNHDNHAVQYHLGLEADAENRRAIEYELRAALANDEFFVEYQPVVSAAGHEIKSAEALVRWRSPARGLVSPAQFIPVAESFGLIQDIGDVVLHRVCQDLASLPGLSISVNVSPVQLKEARFVEDFTKIVRGHGVDPSRIEIELTENVFVDNVAIVSKRIAALKAAGFKLSLDDFGLGFSSLGYLKRLPFDKIKVDRTFVAELGMGDKPNKLLQSVALLSDALDLAIVAEGVEREEQAALLRLLNFDYLQGWLTGRPMSADALRTLMQGRTAEKVA